MKQIILFASILLVNITFAQTNNDSTLLTEDNTTIIEDIDTLVLDTNILEDFLYTEKLDELLKTWYFENLDTLYPYDPSISDTVIPGFSDSIYKLRLDNIESAVELSFNDVVKKHIEVYTKRSRYLTKSMLGLSECYFPIFEEILDKHGIPLELKYLPIIESALNPTAVSRAGATGLWQFMYTTGKLYKLEINSFVDERRDIVKSSEAAARYLKDLYSMYDDWVLALAAYNCGPGNVNRAITRSKGKKNYWHLYHYLPRETRGYVPAFIAVAYAMNYNKEHLINPLPFENDLVDTVMINKPLHFEQVSGVLGIPVKQLKELNPQYIRDIIPAKKKTYVLRLPYEYTTQFIAMEDSIYNFKDSVYFKKINADIPKYEANKYVPAPPSPDMVKVYYTVKSGDNVGFIASWFDIKSSELRYWNNIHRNFLKAGQKLIIYKKKNEADKYSKLETMSFKEKQKFAGVEVKEDNEKEKPLVDDGKGKYEYYTVKSGDNFWSIAKKYPGVSNTDIMQLNGLTNERGLKPGQKLKIKRLD